ncbi:PIR Superfamily Protein [Plasmodium ovale wallikeri]|uniref:PIR Superfamily Protein n=2 Tax=Plasmodium ovale TaxID=36330 RepID=A0A1A8Z835_PLAOA|nr:PIR Superfamily Protein [Plasmodium ovale wallikeri]SBT39994.1 PIR Superfamily Protein [Plasmodium ovale wallikeri]SBT74629.1 Plasmodium vivax Vir protein, putative [Plasmodium ovale]
MSDSSDKEWIQKFCNNIIKNSQYINNIKGEKGHKYQCLQYKYWIYDQVVKNPTKKSEDNNIETFANKFMNHEIRTSKGFIEYNFKYYFSEKKFNELKEKVQKKYLHYYFRNFELNQETTEKCKQDKFSTFEKHLNSIIKLYNIYKENECTYYHFYLYNRCDDYFKIKENYNPKFLLSILENSKYPTKPVEKPYITENSETADKNLQVMFTCHKAFCSNDPSSCNLICKVKKKRRYRKFGLCNLTELFILPDYL